MVRLTRQFVLVILHLLIGLIPVFPQDEVIRVETELVSVPVSVNDKDGRRRAGLTEKDFSIFENDVLQKIEYFGTSDSPLTVLLLLDTSGSMSQHIDRLADAATAFIGKLKPNDRYIVASFGSSIEITVPNSERGTSQRDLILKRFGQPRTHVYDAVDFGLKEIKKSRGRKAIVLFTDGLSEDDRTTAESNLRDAEENEAVIYTVRFGDRSFSMERPRQPALTSGVSGGVGREAVADAERQRMNRETEAYFKAIGKYMSALADRTGGRSFNIEGIRDLDRTFADIVEELGYQYLLGYYPVPVRKPGERRKIKVSVKAPGLVVRARDEVVFRGPVK